MVNKVWQEIFANYENNKQKSVLETIMDASASNRAAVVSACIGGLVIVLVLVVARPSVILTEPSCLYESPKINLLKVASVFALVTILMFALETRGHANDMDAVAHRHRAFA